MAMMAPPHLNRLQLLPDKHLFAGESAKLSPSLLQTVYSPPVNISNSKRSRPAPKTGKQHHLNHLQSKPGATQKERDVPSNEAPISKYDLILLLRTALSKIPQIPFQYIMDVFRWNLFNGTVSMEDANAAFWNLAMNEQGIHPPDWENRKDFFDPGARFHVADNTPFVR